MLRAEKFRAALTLFGFVWGTASVIVLVAWGDGVQFTLERGFAKTGRNMGNLNAGTLSADFAPISDRRYLWINNEDLDVIRRRAKQPELVAGETQAFLPIARGSQMYSVDLRGVEPETTEIRGVPVARGRNVTRSDLLHERRVVVLGHEMEKKLFGAQNALDAIVRVDGVPFRVVGVLSPVGVQLTRSGSLIDDQAWIPMHTFQKQWPEWWTEDSVVDNIFYRMTDPQNYQATRAELRAILAERLGVPEHDTGAILGWSPVEMLNKLQIGDLQLLLFLIAVTTLVIGGIGVLTMMLDTVHERRSEIGVRMALGARRRDVMLQIFAESLSVSVLGGIAGLAFGLLACLGLAALDLPELVPVPRVSWGAVSMTLFVMLLIGLLSGLFPAWRATLVQPAITLRSE